MKYRIFNGEYEDYLDIEGETIEEIINKAQEETERRGWKNCWSKEIE